MCMLYAQGAEQPAGSFLIEESAMSSQAVCVCMPVIIICLHSTDPIPLRHIVPNIGCYILNQNPVPAVSLDSTLNNQTTNVSREV